MNNYSGMNVIYDSKGLIIVELSDLILYIQGPYIDELLYL